MAQVLVEVPYLLAQAVLFSSVSYWMVHFEADPGMHPCIYSCCVHVMFKQGCLHVCVLMTGRRRSGQALSMSYQSILHFSSS